VIGSASGVAASDEGFGRTARYTQSATRKTPVQPPVVTMNPNRKAMSRLRAASP
jgi:hypothetical protein